ncbi:ATP-binding cassette domain-containing protein [Flavobacteriaceae bacterium]|nr:ATP-binding cassette domain-containing protein [Flavobacteriaceae bacterium]
MENLLSIDSVSKYFGDYKALNNVSVDIPKGSIFGLLGPNGAGKTTLIRIINQISIPDAGKVLFNGEDLNSNHIKQIGYLPEERGLYKSMKVGEQALYLAQLKGMSRVDAKKQLKYWFDKFEIGDWWDKKIIELSKGMAQKVQFIVTVLHKPSLLIFDEPFSGFDPINANIIKDEILQLRDEGSTVIFSTHRMESVEELCDHIALIHNSNKVLDGNLNEIKRQYKSNTFEVGIISKNQLKLKQLISTKFKSVDANFRSLGNELKLNISLESNQTPNELLNFLSSNADVNHFIEVVPSANDIFIQTINNQK